MSDLTAAVPGSPVPGASGAGHPGGSVRAARLQRPSWRDWRFVVGLLLVLASVAAGAVVVSAADRTVPVYAARAVLPTGTPLSAEHVRVVRLRLVGSDAAYLDARAPLPTGQVVIRPIGAGELVPVAALAPAATIRLRPVAIPIDGRPPSGLLEGGLVDVWASIPRRGADSAAPAYAAPRRIAAGVEVVGVATPDGGLGPSRDSSVEVLLPAAELAAVLDALANDARIAVLPVPGAAGGTS